MPGYLFILGIPQRGSVDLINDVTGTDKPVGVSLTPGCQVKDEDAPAEVPERGRRRRRGELDGSGIFGSEMLLGGKEVHCWTIQTSAPTPHPGRAPLHTSHTPGRVQKQSTHGNHRIVPLVSSGTLKFPFFCDADCPVTIMRDVFTL